MSVSTTFTSVSALALSLGCLTRVGRTTALLGNIFTVGVGKVLDIYKSRWIRSRSVYKVTTFVTNIVPGTRSPVGTARTPIVGRRASPPRSPKLQCYVERSNRTHREEFYEVEDIAIRLDEHNQHPPSIACPAHPK
jgi:hypothetical protein